MTVHDDLRTVLHVAILTECRTPDEQRAMERLAKRLDAERNRQGGHNPHIDWSWETRQPCTYGPDPAAHTKDCVCRGKGLAIEPRDGWSRLGELVQE